MATTTAATRTMQSLDPDTLSIAHLKMLSLSAPGEAIKFRFIQTFLSQVLNLDSDKGLLEASVGNLPASFKEKLPQEPLPQIAIPSDLWLVPEIVIRNLDTKSAILREVNTLLLQYIDLLQTNGLFLIDEAAISNLEKRITDLHLIDFNQKQAFNHKNESELHFGSVYEAEEYEENDTELSSIFLRRSLSGNLMSKIVSRSTTGTTKNLHRLSSLSRDFLLQKRKLSSFLGQHALVEDDKETTQPAFPLQNLPMLNPLVQLPTNHKDGDSGTPIVANGNFKSRIYSKIKKRRELAASVASTATSVSSINSNPTGRRKSSACDIDPKAPRKETSSVSEFQKVENQRRKHEYYLQIKLFGELTWLIIGFAGKSGLRANLSRLMEFIKNFAFRFILVDTYQMIVDYGHYKISCRRWR